MQKLKVQNLNSRQMKREGKILLCHLVLSYLIQAALPKAGSVSFLLIPGQGELSPCCGPSWPCVYTCLGWRQRGNPSWCAPAGFYTCCTQVPEIPAAPTNSSRAVHSRVSYARQKWKNEHFIVVFSYFIFQKKHLLAPINTLLLHIKIAGVRTGKAIK